MAKAKKKEEKLKTAAPDETNPEEKIIPIGAGEEPVTEEGQTRVDEEPADAAANEIDQLKVQVQQLEDQKLRALAEFDNFRKRSARQAQEIIRNANDRLLGEMLEIVDNFERAIQHQDEDDNNGDAANGDALRKGTELIYSQMIDFLARYDVKAIESLGKPFDPNLHEALMPIESDDYDEGTVAVEISKGYMQGERVLRHAKVGVSKKPGDDKEKGAE